MTILSPKLPPDQEQREEALNPLESILVQAPAGSGKTDLLTRRFLRLLSEVDSPGKIVAITFTKAAAAEMRDRILSELEKAAALSEEPAADDEFSMRALAHRALAHSRRLQWDLLRMPGQLRISTIDSFGRELALQQPLLSGLGGGLDITENPEQLYERAARNTLVKLASPDAHPELDALNPAIESLLLWRDNGWQELESLLIEMLRQRDRWMQDFVFDRDQDWDQLRDRLERSFFRAITGAIERLNALLGQAPGTAAEIMALARYACAESGNTLHSDLAAHPAFPQGPFANHSEVEAALNACHCAASLLLTAGGDFRRSVNVNDGFPPTGAAEKRRHKELIRRLAEVSGLEGCIAGLRKLPPLRYPEEEWQIVRAAFILLRHAAAELKLVFAESGTVDFVEVAQIAQSILCGPDRLPTEAAIAIADDIHHLLVDEFQDTSRRQHRLIGSLVEAWPDTQGRTLFVVGDPMQSIYFFRDADAELFPRVRRFGLDLPQSEPHHLEFVALSSNFRTAPSLVDRLNTMFARIFPGDDSQIEFSEAVPARVPVKHGARFHLHLEFTPASIRAGANDPATLQRKQETAEERERARKSQVDEIVGLVRRHLPQMEAAKERGEKYRVAILGRTRAALEPIAQALREALVPFRAVDLEPLSERPEVLDALALVRALFNPEDRVAWLGILRAPWCGLTLSDLFVAAGGDDKDLLQRPIPALLEERLPLLSRHGAHVVARVRRVMARARNLRTAQPALTLGTWVRQVWLDLGGDLCVEPSARINLDLFWAALDQLQGGEIDVLSPAMAAALADLKAQPDPAASSECGVQLMTIHKSKGLEFEFVIVPDLQSIARKGESRLLSWLERGLVSAEDPDQVTEFLIAPLPLKGSLSGRARDWVNRLYREREVQEMRRILYVATTRAREGLHLFARPEYRTRNGELELCNPTGLLATGWPALEAHVRKSFDDWLTAIDSATVPSLAATSNLLPFPAPSQPAILRRLPAGAHAESEASTAALESATPVEGAARLYERHIGGQRSRAIGSILHLFLEELARLRASSDWTTAQASLPLVLPRAVAALRMKGVPGPEASREAESALAIALDASRTAMAQWILDPHPNAASEACWTGVLKNAVREVRVDRVFQAGPHPASDGAACWWIIDYKTSQVEASPSQEALLRLREQFRPQLELYADVLRKLLGAHLDVRAGLYYPRMQAFDWWTL